MTNHEKLTEHAAERIIIGIQHGGLDFLDVLCMIEDFDYWVENSESGTACELRGEYL